MLWVPAQIGICGANSNHELRLPVHDLTCGHELHFVHELPAGIKRNSIHGAQREFMAQPIHDGAAVNSSSRQTEI